MGKVIITTNASLDGVIQDPDGKEGFARGGWFNGAGPRNLEAWAEVELDEALGAAALLLGRRSDEWFAARWLGREGAFADRLNGLPKYVVSGTLQRPEWSNATILRGDPAAAVAALKAEVDGDILVYASYRLGRALIEHGLVDEVRLMIFPVLAGAGERLFGETAAVRPLRLLSSRPVGDGIVYVTYRFG
jgi:dihydrofolate reductase